MTHYGIISVSATGPLNTMLPLGQELQRRGHQVTLIALLDAQPKAEAAGIPLQAVGQVEFPVGRMKAALSHLGKLSGLAALRYTIELLNRESEVFLRDGPEISRKIGVEALLVNQGAQTGGTLADHLHIPFITVCSAVVLNQDPSIPPFNTQWPYSLAWSAQLRNRFGYWLLSRAATSIRNTIQHYRQQWQLPAYRQSNDNYSGLAQISQAPADFEFPRRTLPPWFHFTGPFHTTNSREPIPFPWERLEAEKPIIYASMGTLQNQLLWVFEQIAEACSSLDAQLVISLGGSTQPEDLPQLAGEPIVVGYAPQLDILQRATIMITHAGMNTTMECLMHGVPMLAIPVANDQPGVSSRIVWSGVGERISLRSLTVEKLRVKIQSVLTQPSYKEVALRLKAACRSGGGVNKAADIIETAITTGQPVLAQANPDV
ncbi:glycosyltransferase [Acaryochloris sp. IP29b_bin.148]|uniref:glycosyltransferase n=1 Tax=Acaryochloris sp. IP29b_bin.148 TaxID=2969218 RepID=UPI00262AFC40|nr:glycosyltransferase [Acaryochloris sp. IP29b_bin.148]